MKQINRRGSNKKWKKSHLSQHRKYRHSTFSRVNGLTRETASNRYARWTVKELDFVRDHGKTMLIRDLAKKLGRSYAAVLATANKNRISLYHPDKNTGTRIGPLNYARSTLEYYGDSNHKAFIDHIKKRPRIQMSRGHPVFTPLGWRKIGIFIGEGYVRLNQSCFDKGTLVLSTKEGLKLIDLLIEGEDIIVCTGNKQEARVVKVLKKS